MEDIFLQTIIEKLETLTDKTDTLDKRADMILENQAGLKDLKENARSYQLELQAIPHQISVAIKSVQDQRKSVIQLTERLNIQLEQKSKTIRYLQVFIAFSFFQMVAIGIFFWDFKSNSRLTQPLYNTKRIIDTVSHELHPREFYRKTNKLKSKNQSPKMNIHQNVKAIDRKTDSVYHLLMNKYEQTRQINKDSNRH